MRMRLLGSLSCKLNTDFGNDGSLIKFHISVYLQAPWGFFPSSGIGGLAGWRAGGLAAWHPAPDPGGTCCLGFAHVAGRGGGR